MDRIARISCQVALITLVALSAPSAARAEGFVDLRVGGAFTEDGDVELTPGPDFESEFEDSVTGGIRAGYWFDVLPFLGLAGDVTYFGPDDETFGADIDVIPISPLLMLRAPLVTSEEFPNGRVQPFAGIGPGIFVSIVELPNGADDESVDVGLDIHAGLKVHLTPVVAVFGQYRFTHFEADVDILGVDIESELDTHHVAGGLGFHF